MESRPQSKMPLGIQILICTVVSVAIGFGGGYIAEYLEAPFFFGFLFAGVLAGMVGMFIMAAHLAASRVTRK